MSQTPPPVPPGIPPPTPVAPPVPPPMPVVPLQYAVPRRNDVREIAIRQKAIMYCILGYVACVALQFAVPQDLRIVLALAGVAISITGAVFVFMLAIALYNTGVGVLLGILTLVPLLGLIVLLIVNGRATKVLRENGIQVGLMGARRDQIPSP